jgi:tRNA (cytidine32/uridine32-2'-O)-methyltransferase
MRVVTQNDFSERDILCFSSFAAETIKLDFYETLDEALEGCNRVIGTSRRLRDPDAPPEWPAAGLADRIEGDATTAILFGAERTGLLKEELDRCSAVVHIPTTDVFASMNLAHAVACFGYELARPRADEVGPHVIEEAPRLDAAARESFFGFVQQSLETLGYPPGRSAEAFVRRLRKVMYRANPSQQELNMLGGVFSELLRLGTLAGVVDPPDDDSFSPVRESEPEQ